MTIAKMLVPVILTVLLFLSGCAKQQPTPTIPDASIAIIETTAPVDVSGSWVMDREKTEENLKTAETLLGVYGTGLQQGSEMELGEDGFFRYYIGIGQGGEGTYILNGGTVEAQLTPYEDNGFTPESLTVTVFTENGKTWLVMEDGGETIYWKRT